jgi:hypothetical protein
MTRPLRGAREVQRRLQERNEARRERTNQVRQLGGLEPIPEPAERNEGLSFAMRQAQEHMMNYLSNYGGYGVPLYQRRIIEGMWEQQEVERMELPPVRISTEVPNWSMTYLSTGQPVGLPEGVFNELHSSNPCSEIFMDTEGSSYSFRKSTDNDFLAYMRDDITHEEYMKRLKLRDIKDKENANNKDFKFILEAEY